MNKKILIFLVLASLSIFVTPTFGQEYIKSTDMMKTICIDELYDMNNVKIERYTIDEFYNLMLKEKNTEAIKYIENKYPYIINGIQPYVEDFTYVERVSFTDKQTASCDLISGMALEFYAHSNGKIDILGYVDGTAFCKSVGISSLKFVNDYEPIVRIPNNRTATINVSGSLEGEVSASLEAEFSASGGFEIVEVGGSIGGSVNGTIYVSKDISLSHKYIEYGV